MEGMLPHTCKHSPYHCQFSVESDRRFFQCIDPAIPLLLHDPRIRVHPHSNPTSMSNRNLWTIDTNSNTSLLQIALYLDKLTTTRPEILASNELIYKVRWPYFFTLGAALVTLLLIGKNSGDKRDGSHLSRLHGGFECQHLRSRWANIFSPSQHFETHQEGIS